MAGSRRSTHLCGRALVASVLQQVSHHLQVVLLSSHVQRSEAILQHTEKIRTSAPVLQPRLRGTLGAHLRLRVDVRPSFHQDLHHLQLTRQRGDVERCVPLLQSQNIILTAGRRSQKEISGPPEATCVEQISSTLETMFQLGCPATVAVCVRSPGHGSG